MDASDEIQWSRVLLRDGEVIYGVAKEALIAGAGFLDVACADTRERKLSIVDVREIEAISEEEALGSSSAKADLSKIRQLVSDEFQIPVGTLTGSSRMQNVFLARAAIYWLGRELGYSSSMIGEACGGRDHGAVLSGVPTAQMRYAMDANYRWHVENLRRKLCHREWEFPPDK